MNICEITFNYFCSCCSQKEKEKRKLLLKVEKKINSYLEIYKYIQTVQDVDMIKKCLFNKDERILFDFLS